MATSSSSYTKLLEEQADLSELERYESEVKGKPSQHKLSHISLAEYVAIASLDDMTKLNDSAYIKARQHEILNNFALYKAGKIQVDEAYRKKIYAVCKIIFPILGKDDTIKYAKLCGCVWPKTKK